jgi:hypothetical protein
MKECFLKGLAIGFCSVWFVFALVSLMPTVYAKQEECLKVHTAVQMAQLTADYIDKGKLPWYSKLICTKTGADK